MRERTDTTLLDMALIGYEAEREKVQQKIVEIQRQLGGGSPRSARSAAGSPAPAKRRMSAQARKRIAAAQKKRWAAYRKKARKAI